MVLSESGQGGGALTMLDTASAPAGAGDLGCELQRLARLGETDPMAAAQGCRAALDAHPGRAELWLLRGLLLDDLGVWRKAETAFKRVIELSPGDLVARRLLARLLLEQGRIGKALAALDAPLGPSGGDLAPVAAALLIDIGDFESALERLEALTQAPAAPDVEAQIRTARAGIASDRGRGLDPKAKRSYLRALERLAGGDPAGAEPLLEAVVRRAPSFAPAWAVLEGVRGLAGRPASDPLGAPAEAGPLLKRRLGGRGLVFDPRDRFPVRGRAGRLTEVGSGAELAGAPDSWLALEAGGQPRTAGPSIGLGGPGDDFRAAFETSEVFLASLSDAAVVGRGVVITAAGELISELARGPAPDKFGARREGDAVVFDPRPFRDGLCPVAVFDEPAMLMTGPTDSSFGDWMVNFLPRLSIARRAGLDPPLVVRTSARPFVRSTLSFLGIGEDRLVEHDRYGVSVFRRLYVPSWPMPDRRAAMAAHLDGLMVKPARRPVGGPKRLYLSREHMPIRSLANEAEVRARFEARGFVAIHPERLSLEEVHGLLGGASHVAGGYGSAWLNLAFCEMRPACLVCAPAYYDGYLREISLWLGALDVRFGLLLGEHEPATKPGKLRDEPWRIDRGRLDEAIDRFLA